MAHPLHDLSGVGRADRVGAEDVAEVVEAEGSQASLLERGLVAVVTSMLVALAELGQRLGHLIGFRGVPLRGFEPRFPD